MVATPLQNLLVLLLLSQTTPLGVDGAEEGEKEKMQAVKNGNSQTANNKDRASTSTFSSCNSPQNVVDTFIKLASASPTINLPLLRAAILKLGEYPPQIFKENFSKLITNALTLAWTTSNSNSETKNKNNGVEGNSTPIVILASAADTLVELGKLKIGNKQSGQWTTQDLGEAAMILKAQIVAAAQYEGIPKVSVERTLQRLANAIEGMNTPATPEISKALWNQPSALPSPGPGQPAAPLAPGNQNSFGPYIPVPRPPTPIPTPSPTSAGGIR
jgi:hypothetical protein